MAISVKRTGSLGATAVKILGYGPAGHGKTRAISTLPTPITLSAEGGLLSIKEFDLPYVEISTLEDLYDAYRWVSSSDEAKAFESVALDSISEIAEVLLSAEKKVQVGGKPTRHPQPITHSSRPRCGRFGTKSFAPITSHRAHRHSRSPLGMACRRGHGG